MKNKTMNLVMMAGFIMAIASANAGIIYSHNFGGLGTDNLNGTDPEVRPAGSTATWVACDFFKQDGSIVAEAGGSATLAFSPENGNIYTLDASLAGVTGTAQGVWFGLAFAKGQSTGTGDSYRFITSNLFGRAWMNYKWDADKGHRALMNGVSNNEIWTAGADIVSENIDLRIVLDTTGGAGSWAATWYAKWPGDTGYTKVRDTAGLLSEDITSVGLAVSKKGISGTVKSFSLDVIHVNAHTPDPLNNATRIEADLTGRSVPGSISWQAPDDPNIVSIVGYNVYMDPNQVKVQNATAVSPNTQFYSLNQAGADFDPGVDLDYLTTYYWRVDAVVDYDYIPGSDPNIVPGSVWYFTTVPMYVPPQLTINSVITTMDFLPANISAEVTQNSDPIDSVTFTLMTDDYQFPAGADASVTDTTTDNQNPTATFTTDMAGTYKVKLQVSDGTTTIEDVIEIVVYADACQAKKDSPSGWTASYYDRDGNCTVDLSDFMFLAMEWLNNTSMTAPESYSKDVFIVPMTVYNSRIEAENPHDLNSCSTPPITDSSGIQVYSDASRSGGQLVGGATAGNWIEYDVDIAAGTYDVYLESATDTDGRMLSFGTAAAPDAYGVVAVANTGDLAKYALIKGQVTFTDSGSQTLRITWSGGVDLDWFAFNQP